MGTARFRVRLARPVFQVVTLDVQAEDKAEAVVKALSHADRIAEEEWTGRFAPENYFYDAQYVVEVEEPESEAVDTTFGYTVDRYTNYLLLKADTFSGEGDVLFQPWMSDISVQMARELCKDWMAQLERITDGDALRGFERMGPQGEEAKRKHAKVIPIRRPPPEE